MSISYLSSVDPPSTERVSKGSSLASIALWNPYLINQLINHDGVSQYLELLLRPLRQNCLYDFVTSGKERGCVDYSYIRCSLREVSFTNCKSPSVDSVGI